MSARQAGAARKGASKRLIYLVVGLMVSAAASFGTFIYVGQQAEYDQTYVNLASEEQVLSQHIAKLALAASGGDAAAFEQLAIDRSRFAETLGYLAKGNTAIALQQSDEALAESLSHVQSTWERYSTDVDTVLAGKEMVLFLTEAVAAINEVMPQLVANSEEIVNILVAKNSSPKLVSIASRQLMLSQRIVNNVNQVLTGKNTETATEVFVHDVEEYGVALEGMVRGNTTVAKIKDKAVQAKLFDGSMLFKVVADYVGEILGTSEDLIAIQQAAARLSQTSDSMFDASADLQSAYQTAASRRAVRIEHAYVAGVLGLFFLFWLGYALVDDARQRGRAAEETNRKNQEAILRLLDEMGNLSDGDLTRYATVTEDFTGAIADSINYTIDAIREVVETINKTSEQVSHAAEQTKRTAVSLANASSNQAEQITSASTAINEMASSIDEVSQNARESTEVAHKAVEIANKGGKTVRRTIEGMDSIREQIQETSKRIKRLGESSQEIGDIVELINDIAEQTNILALNAAIQAAMAGEAGRGFAVVADEVQRLAERSANATKQIEALVKTIQTDTNEAVISMEQSTAGVVNGAHLAEDAGDALDEIVNVSTRLAELVDNISNSASQQSAAAANISDTMNAIQEITTQTNAATNETASSSGNLSKLAGGLRKSVAGFTLPE
jgi:twitching motility protein PilJ